MQSDSSTRQLFRKCKKAEDALLQMRKDSELQRPKVALPSSVKYQTIIILIHIFSFHYFSRTDSARQSATNPQLCCDKGRTNARISHAQKSAKSVERKSRA